MDANLIDPLRAQAENVLRQALGMTARIERAELLTEVRRRNHVWRCRLSEENHALPASVIIKQVDPAGYDPANLDSWATQRFFSDWIGAQFLSEVCGDSHHSAHFLGGNRELGFVVLEDLGEHSSLVQPLLEGDADSATQALFAFATRLGRLHADTFGRQAEFIAILRALSPQAADRMEQMAARTESDWGDNSKKLTRLLAEIGVQLNGSDLQDMGDVINDIAHPDQFAVFIHSDPCPDNVFYWNGETKLIDFEFAKFGHALRDGLYGRVPFPTCWCANRVPNEIVRGMESVYRAELATTCKAARDDEMFDSALVAACGFWTLHTLDWHLEGALKGDSEWGIATIRARILTRLDMFVSTAMEQNRLPAMSAAMTDLRTHLRDRWPESEPLPLYPAFR